MTPQLLKAASAALALAALGSCASGGKGDSSIGRADGPSVKVAGPTEVEPYTPLTTEQQAIGFALAEPTARSRSGTRWS